MSLKGSFSRSPIIIQLLIILFFLFFGSIIGALLFIWITSGTDILLGQGILSSFTFIFPSWLFYFLFCQQKEDTFTTYFQVNLAPSFRLFLLAVLLMLLSTPLVNYLTEWNKQMDLPDSLSTIEQWMKETERQATEVTKELLNTHSLYGLIQNLMILALVPAIGEELVFRGTLIKLFRQRISLHTSVWLSAILFSAFHLQFYGFLPRMILGALLGYLFVWSRSLWLSIAAHFVNNAVVILAAYFSISDTVDKIGTEGPVWSVILSLLITICLLYLVYSFSKSSALAKSRES